MRIDVIMKGIVLTASKPRTRELRLRDRGLERQRGGEAKDRDRQSDMLRKTQTDGLSKRERERDTQTENWSNKEPDIHQDGDTEDKRDNETRRIGIDVPCFLLPACEEGVEQEEQEHIGPRASSLQPRTTGKQDRRDTSVTPAADMAG